MSNRRRAVAISVVTILVGLLVGLRLSRLDADFPAGLTWSGAPYTDEGWYSKAPVALRTVGRWHVDGDFNTWVTMPANHLIQHAMFGVQGMGLVSARRTSALFGLLLVVASYLVVAQLADRRTATLTIVFLLTDFLLFAYSRLALLEVTMTALLVLAMLAACWRSAPAALSGALAGILVAAAVLTKQSGLFGIPVVALLFFLRRENRRDAVIATATFGVVTALIVGGYHVAARAAYPQDWAYFHEMTLGERTERGPWQRIVRFVRSVYKGWWPLLHLIVIAVLTIFSLAFWRGFARDRLVIVALVWSLPYVVMIAGQGYAPPRYFVPFSFAAAALAARLLTGGRAYVCRNRWSNTVVVVCVVIVTFNLVQCAHAVIVPRYSMRDMLNDVSRRIESSQVAAPLLLGPFADTVALATGVPSVNDEFGTLTLEDRVKQFRPTHFLTWADRAQIIEAVRSLGSLEELARYDVFGNYYRGEGVILYRFRPTPTEAPLSRPSSPNDERVNTDPQDRIEGSSTEEP